MELLFVYGTLRSPFELPLASVLKSAAKSHGEAYVCGRLFLVEDNWGRYPALSLAKVGAARDQAAWVKGELFCLPADRGEREKLLQRLDQYEEASTVLSDPECDYHRLKTKVYLEPKLKANSYEGVWIYSYSRPTKNLREIISASSPGAACFLEWCQKNSLQAGQRPV